MSEKVTIKVERKKLHLPTIALRGLVVFPNNLVHFEVGREKSIAAVEWAMANNSNVFLVAQKEMELSDPTQEDLFVYGVVAEVKQVLRVSDDLVKVLVEGKYRAKLTDLDTTGDFLLASVRPAPVRVGKTEDAVETEALLRALKSRAYITTMLARPSFMPGRRPGMTSEPSMNESAMASANNRPDRAMCRVFSCLLYTSDAADEEDSVDLGGGRIIQKKKKKEKMKAKKNLREEEQTDKERMSKEDINTQSIIASTIM